MMRWGIFLSFLSVLVLICAVAESSEEPLWALISTEVDDGLDGAGTFMDREVLQLWPPNFPWSGSPADVFFDPGDVFGIETGLDAFHVAHEATGDLYFFSTEVDFEYGGAAYEDEDLLVYDTSSGLVAQALDVKNVLGADYGLDAACWLLDPNDQAWMLAFSTEVGGQYWEPDESGGGLFVPFSDGDILVTDGVSIIGMLSLEAVFGRNVGLDALHGWIEVEEAQTGAADLMYLQILLSTEVDGSMPEINGEPNDLQRLIDFKDQDILSLTFAMPDGPGPLLQTEVAWRGIEDGFGKDVGLDALYVEIPEPATMLLVGLGLGALGVIQRKRTR